ncbi:hypothetical protein ABID29_001640 [Streptococcus rupicaprae]|uniref:Uncharacterized protein n=1 Tax=Streptococcus rupicaprae TaxID=759619 RepID=A0ABV2FIY0_9STRE
MGRDLSSGNNPQTTDKAPATEKESLSASDSESRPDTESSANTDIMETQAQETEDLLPHFSTDWIE